MRMALYEKYRQEMAARRVMTERRIQWELSAIRQEQFAGYSVWEENSSNWTASVLGPANSPYEDGLFFLNVTLPENYPFSCPDIFLLTPIYHPNITEHGRFCPCFPGWRIAMTIADVLLDVRALMAAPNDHLIRADIAAVYRADKQKFEDLARQWTLQYAV